MYLKCNWMTWTGLILLRIETSGEIRWRQKWTLLFMKFGEIFWAAEELLASQEGLCCMELIFNCWFHPWSNLDLTLQAPSLFFSLLTSPNTVCVQTTPVFTQISFHFLRASWFSLHKLLPTDVACRCYTCGFIYCVTDSHLSWGAELFPSSAISFFIYLPLIRSCILFAKVFIGTRCGDH